MRDYDAAPREWLVRRVVALEEMLEDDVSMRDDDPRATPGSSCLENWTYAIEGRREELAKARAALGKKELR